MTVLEMHGEVRAGLNQQGANRNLKYFPEEIDSVLNKHEGRFIQSCLKPRQDGSGGFEIDQFSTDKIRTLLRTASLVPYDKTGWYECYLPHDYAYLVSDASVSRDLCGGTITSTPKTVYIYGIRQDRSVKVSPKYYITNVVTLKNKTVSIPGDLQFGHEYTGFNVKVDIQGLIPHIALIGGFWWEKLWDVYYPGHYLFATETELTGNSQVIVDGTTTSTTMAITKVEKVHVGGTTKVNNRLTPSSMVPRLNGTEFYKSAAYSPVSELLGNTLKVYHDNSFIVSNVEISYIRKPRPISLSLNSNSELPDEFHQTICDLTVEHLKGRLENTQGQQLAERDIDKRVTL